MREGKIDEPTQPRPLRLRPGVVVVALQWLVRFGILIVMPEAVILAVLGGLIGGSAVLLWWAFFSRAPLPDRWGAVVLIAIALIATQPILHESMGLLPFYAYIIPSLSLAFVVWAVASRRLSDRPRRASLVGTVLLACGVWALFRTAGTTGDLTSEFA